MEYHQHQPMAPHHQHMNHYGSQFPPQSVIPDGSSVNEKTLMWHGSSSFMSPPESGYSTTAPSISSVDAFLNNEQMDSSLHSSGFHDNASTISAPVSSNTVITPPAPVQYTQLQPPQQQIQQVVSPPQNQQETIQATEENAIADWMNYQDNSEMALKAIPDLLKLLLDDDALVVQQASLLLKEMSRMEIPSMGLINHSEAVHCLVDCLVKTQDIDTAKNLVGALYGISTQKPLGVQAIVNSKAIEPLIKILGYPFMDPNETIANYAITAIHNVLCACGDSFKAQMRKLGAVQAIVPLLARNHNVKFLAIVIDCLLQLAFGNQESKLAILEMCGTNAIIGILTNHGHYPKLLFNAIRLLKVLSVCSKNKEAMIAMNVIPALAMHLVGPAQNPASMTTDKFTYDIVQTCLATLRNLSDAATRLNGLEKLVETLFLLLSNVTEIAIATACVGILGNLTCNNENNKKAAMKSNGIAILLKIVHQNMNTQKPQLVEPTLCILRHISTRQSESLLAQEQIRHLNGLKIITEYMAISPRSWFCTKALLGLVRNLCSSQLNASQLRMNGIIEKLMQVLFDAFTECQTRTNNYANVNPNTPLVVKVEDVNLLDIIDACATSLLILAKDQHNQIIMKDLDCIGFFVQMFCTPVMNNQKAASSLLAELACNRDCARVIDEFATLHQFVFLNFCNQQGHLKTISDLTGTTPNSSAHASASIILTHVTTLMQRLQEHKHQFMLIQQQQQQQQRQYQQKQEPFQQQGFFYPPQTPMGMPPQHIAGGPFQGQPFYN